jgi:NTP pyrophosphatase (non-canonical NTP hydrolase)
MGEKQTARSVDDRAPAVPLQPLIDPAGWNPRDMEKSEAWIYRLSETETGEIVDAVTRLDARGADLQTIGSGDFLLPGFGSKLCEIRDELMKGRGFALLRGLPFEQMTQIQFAKAFWGLGTYLGTPVSQNKQGELMGHVKDQGGTYLEDRAYTTSAALSFHCDSCDILGLACLNIGKSGGEHRICSSVTLYNEMLKRRPDLVKELIGKFPRARPGDGYGEGTPWILQSVFAFHDGYFTSRGASQAIYKAQTLPGVPKLTPAQMEALALFKEMSEQLALEIPFRPGDLFFVMNHTLMHARNAYEDWPESHRKRHLLRLWLSNGIRPLPEDIAKRMSGVRPQTGRLHIPIEAP